MKLRGIELGNVFLSSGSRNIDGKGWKQDVFFRWHPGFNFSGATPILKTITIDSRMPGRKTKGKDMGNLVINPYTFQTEDWFPDCVKIDFFRDRITNAAGLTNPGAEFFFKQVWPEIKEKVVLSVMCVRASKEARQDEAMEYVEIAKKYIPKKGAIVALEVNETCPSIKKHGSTKLYDETIERLAVFQRLDIPLIVKLDALATVEFIKELEASRMCDAIDIPNALPIYAKWDKINWHKLEYLTRLVFQIYATCGYSGRENFELALEIVRDARQAGVTLPIIIGGISCVEDIHKVREVGGQCHCYRASHQNPFLAGEKSDSRRK